MKAGIEPTMIPRMLIRRQAGSLPEAVLADAPPRAGRYATPHSFASAET